MGYAVLNIVNISLDTRLVAGVFKISVAVPIPKVSNPICPSEFRPTNVLPALNNVLKIAVCK